MMTRRLLASSLMLLCLVAFGCDSDDNSASEKTKANRTEYSAKLERSRDSVSRSLKKTRDLIGQAQTGKQEETPAGAGRPSQSPTPLSTREPLDRIAVREAATVLKSNAEPLDAIESALQRASGTEKSRSALSQLRTFNLNALNLLSSVENDLNADDDKNKPDAGELTKTLADAKAAIEKSISQLAQIEIPPDLESPPSPIWQAVYDYGPLVGKGLAVVVGLILLLVAVKAAMRISAARADERITNKLKPLASNVQKQHEDFASRLTSLIANHQDLKTRIDDLEYELKRVSKTAREAAGDGMRRHSFASAASVTTFSEPVERDEPVFPISSGDYLNKMQRSSNIVKPDFQNDILVTDPGGTGELVLIRDTAIPDELQPLFVIPRFTQFQTKQDFYTYYQKYYECARPSAGDVWIIDPAVVSRVSGGWQLREKGVLEVR